MYHLGDEATQMFLLRRGCVELTVDETANNGECCLLFIVGYYNSSVGGGAMARRGVSS